MQSVKADFRERASEVRRYFHFVFAAANGSAEINIIKEDPDTLGIGERDELLKTLKASCYLLLYNLVESTMRNVIETIFDEFRAENVRFDDCRDEIKRLVLVNFRARNPDKLLAKLTDIACHVVTETFEAKEMFAGNIDAKEIRETADKFGFAPPSKNTGWMMRSVKDNRNDLAHGNKSFSEIGKDVTPDRLEEARKQTFVILFLTLRNVSTYLSRKKYLAANINN
jgi:hypothetical protein